MDVEHFTTLFDFNKRNIYISRFMYKQLLVKTIVVDCPWDFIQLWASEIDVLQDPSVQRSIALPWKEVTPIIKLRYLNIKPYTRNFTTNIQVSRWNDDVSSLSSFLWLS